ncbi:MAG: ATP-binding protein [Fulvivirga sp.]|uniref:hybrid sensor histidine kinase/response regulator n=1 Tax=Fulvivirga sp. TaxID=1931237 RepID=UPI0032EAF228
MSITLNILFVEDVLEDFEYALLELEKNSLYFEATRVDSKNQLIEELDKNNYDLIICDNQLPSMDAKCALKITRELNEEIPFIICSGSLGEDQAVELMRLGANDYINKYNLNKLVPVIKREIKDYENKKKKAQFQKELVLSELRYKKLTESISDIFFAIDFDYKIVFWNTAAENELKKDVNINDKLFELFPEWKDEEIADSIKRAMTTRQPKSFSLTTYISNELVHFEGRVASSDKGASILIRNMTETYLNSIKLERVNNELEALLYRTNHDLKGPLSSVQGLLNIMKITPDFNTTQFIGMMSERINHLDKILNKLTDIAYIKYGSFKQQEIDIKQTIEEIISSNMRNGNWLNSKIELNSDKNHSIKIDLMLFNIIIKNLIDNAVAFGVSENGEVLITMTLCKLEKSLSITMTDEGKGIPPDIKNKIFEMFYRGNESSTGSGLGLYILKEALCKINGDIILDSEFKNGARFKINIPFTESPI